MVKAFCCFFVFFFNDTATTEIYTLSLHDALPISYAIAAGQADRAAQSFFSRQNLDLIGLVEEVQLQIGRAHV